MWSLIKKFRYSAVGSESLGEKSSSLIGVGGFFQKSGNQIGTIFLPEMFGTVTERLPVGPSRAEQHFACEPMSSV
jgi:hypothetical protein